MDLDGCSTGLVVFPGATILAPRMNATKLNIISTSSSHATTATTTNTITTTTYNNHGTSVNYHRRYSPLGDQEMAETVFESPPTTHLTRWSGSSAVRYLRPFRENSTKSPACREGSRIEHPTRDLET